MQSLLVILCYNVLLTSPVGGGRMHELVGWCVNKWIDEWMNEWIDEQMDGSFLYKMK